MTKAELVEAVLKETKGVELTKKAATELVDNVFAQIKKAVKKDKKFSFPDFGTFTIKSRKARTGRNPQTGEEIKIKASKTVGFKPAPSLKTSL
jgi:DNA-binding protein HU-beta